MKNHAYFTAIDLKTIFNENAFVPDYLATVGVSTDTRTLEPGNIFVALQGERFDGHNNINDAIIKGAVCIVFEKRWLETWHSTLGIEYPSFPRIVVDNTLHALGKLAHYHRKRFLIPVVAIAGAAGKTSTKELTKHLLSQQFNTLYTAANYNNQVGTPLTLLQLHKKHQAAVIEIGTNEPGEIEILSEMTLPTHGVITNIGKEHLEKLINLDGVEKEETSLFRTLNKIDSTAIINLDDERLKKYVSTQHRCTTFSLQQSADVSASVSFTNALHPVLTIQYANSKHTVTCNTIGYAAALNSICSAAVALSVGLTIETVCKGLESYTSPEVHGYARMVVEHINGLTVLNDCYNANPESMNIALQTLAAYPTKGKRVALLGDMRELGEASESEHLQLLEHAVTQTDIQIVVGEYFQQAANSLNSMSTIYTCSTHKEAADIVMKLVSPDDIILVKGSRGLALEKVLELLKNM